MGVWMVQLTNFCVGSCSLIWS